MSGMQKRAKIKMYIHVVRPVILAIQLGSIKVKLWKPGVGRVFVRLGTCTNAGTN